jgi:hypothetical protein
VVVWLVAGAAAASLAPALSGALLPAVWSPMSSEGDGDAEDDSDEVTGVFACDASVVPDVVEAERLSSAG